MSRLAPHRQRGFGLVAALVLVFLYAPIAVLVFFSFNAGRLFHRFDGFSLAWYDRAFANDGFHVGQVGDLLHNVRVPASRECRMFMQYVSPRFDALRV